MLFTIGQFPWLFGTERGVQFRAWAQQWGLPVVWGLGPEGCYQGVNQAGGACNPHSTKIEGGGSPPFRASSRFLDPEACQRTTDSKAANPEASAAFESAWAAAVSGRAAGTWNASAAYRELVGTHTDFNCYCGVIQCGVVWCGVV